MTAKTESSNSLETFEFGLTHLNIVQMMNDPEVLLDEGTVLEGQVLELVIRNDTNNKERFLADNFKSGETIIFRFRKVVDLSTETPLNDPDIPV